MLFGDLGNGKAALVGMIRRMCLFWGMPIYALRLSEGDKELLRTDARTRRWLAFMQMIPVRVLMALPLAFLFATRSKATLLWGLLLLGLLYVPFVGLVGFYVTYRLGHLDVHLRRRYSGMRTGMWYKQG